MAAAVDGFGHQRVHSYGLRVLERVVVLYPGEVDELLHEIDQAGGLDLHAAGEAADRLGVVRGVHDGLGQQGDGPDRRLQLVRHVRDEIAPYGLDAAGLGEVLDQEQDEPGAEGGDARRDREGLAAAGTAPGQVELDLAYLPVAARVAGHVEHGLDGQFAAAYEPEGVSGGRGLDDGVPLVEYDGGGAEHGEDGVHAGREHRIDVGAHGAPGGAGLVALAPAERQHRDHTGAKTGDRCSCGDRRVHVHASRLSRRNGTSTAVRVAPRTVVAQSSPWRRG